MYLHVFAPKDLSQWLFFTETTLPRQHVHCIFLFVLWEDTQGSTLNALDLALDFSCQKDVFAFLFAQFLKSLEEVW
jgi:hypothetical protein